MLLSKALKLASVAAVAGLLAMPAFVGEANAAAKAFSSLHIDDFIINDADGQLDFNDDFDLIVGGNSGENSANLTGFAGVTFGAGPVLGNVDPAHACVGNGCAGIGENDFSQQPYPPSDSFSRGDSRVLGTGITGVPGATQDFVTADTVAGVQLLGAPAPGESGTGASAVGTDTVFNFSLADDRQLTFSFTAQGTLHLILDPDSQLGSVTGADFRFSITIRDEAGNVVFQWAPDGTLNANIVGGTENADGANLTQAVSRLLPGETFIDTGLAFFSATTDLLGANVNYTLTIAHSSFARATLIIAVPEPVSLALFSLGLLAIGGLIVMQRRRSIGGRV